MRGRSRGNRERFSLPNRFNCDTVHHSIQLPAADILIADICRLEMMIFSRNIQAVAAAEAEDRVELQFTN